MSDTVKCLAGTQRCLVPPNQAIGMGEFQLFLSKNMKLGTYITNVETMNGEGSIVTRPDPPAGFNV